jgi:hypothetical protein
MKIMGVNSQGFPTTLYVGTPDSHSLRDRLRQLAEAWMTIEFDPSRDHPRRELSVARHMQLIINAYVIALEKETATS